VQTISVLGPVDVTDVPKAARRLLAVLSWRAGALVRTDEAIDALWGGQPPATARKSLQNHVVRLRQRLGADAITTEPDGYRLLISTDAALFQRLARTDAGAALAMWRSDPWPELDDWPPAAAERARLIELKLAAEETATEQSLDVADAQRLVDEQPLRERRWCILLRALYGDGRQADALRAAQRARAMLRDELGLEPGPELRAVEAAISRHDLDPSAGSVSAVVSTDDALRFGTDAHQAGDHMLAIQWLRMAGPRPEARLVLASAAFAAGDAAAGLEALRDVVERAVNNSDAATAVDALVCLTAGRGPSALTPTVAHLFDTVDRLHAAFDDDQRTTTAACRVIAHAQSVGRDQLAPLLQAVHAHASATQRTRTLVQLSDLVALDRPHDAERRLALATSIERCGDADLDHRMASIGRITRLWSLLELGDPGHRVARDELLTAAAMSRHAVDRADAAVWGGRAVLDGDLAAAERDALEWVGPLATREGPGLATSVQPAFMFTIRWMQGRLAELVPMLEVGVAAMPEVATWRSALAMAYADAGRLEPAREMLDTFIDAGLKLDVGYGLWSATAFHLVHAAVAVRADDAIRLLINELSPIADRHAFYLSHHLGAFHHHLGRLHAVAGETTRAREHLELAAKAHDELGSRWWSACSRRCLAAIA